MGQMSWSTDPLGAGFTPSDGLAWTNTAPLAQMSEPSDPLGSLGKMTVEGGGFFGDMTGMDKVNAGIGSLKTLGSLWAAWQSMKMAKKQFNLTKELANANLGNQVKSYNTALTDRITTRAQLQGMSAADAQAYLNTHSLNKKGT